MSNGPGPGTGGNVLAALCSFVIPGLGQLLQGRIVMAAFQFLLACLLWGFCLVWIAWITNIGSALDAALYRG